MAGVSLFWFYHILRSSGIWTDAGQHEIYLFDRKATGSFKNENEFFISLIRVKPKKSFLEEIVTIYKPVGQLENWNNIYIPLLCTV